MGDRTSMLSAVFSAQLDEPSKETIETMCTRAGFVAGAFGLGPDVPRHYWQAAGTNVLRSLQSALDQPIGELIANAWQQYEPFLKYCDPGRFPAGMVSQEELLERTIEIKCEPAVDVLLDGTRVTGLDFEVGVALTIRSLVLSIDDGRIVSLHVGNVSASGSIAYKGKTLIKRESGKLELPGEIRLGNGIPIGPRSEARVPVAAQSQA